MVSTKTIIADFNHSKRTIKWY